MKAFISAVLLTVAQPQVALGHAVSLPLGDGRVAAAPARGTIFACQSQFGPGPGAHRTGEWIRQGRWYPGEKPVVEGGLYWPNAAISITVEGPRRIVRANALPKHETGLFPVRPGSRAFDYDRNPNTIAEHAILLRLPAKPQPAPKPACVPMGMIGFALSGVAIFNALDLGGRDAPAYEIQDKCNGHPERSSLYHYHNWSPCLANPDKNAPVGWMLDGFPILGPEDTNGQRFTNADLDACHGRVGSITIAGRAVVMYHYRFTDEYPYTIGCFRGSRAG